ncbi:MAG: hypothetical protein ACXWUG_06175 [Polyangiales bacterium]
MRRLFTVWAIALSTSQVLGAPPKVADHVCAKDEGKETCPVGQVRMCTKDGALASCSCPPGSKETSSKEKAACAIDAAPNPITVACVVPDATIGKAMAPFVDFGSFEMPPLPTSQLPAAADAVAGREDTASADELADGAKAWDGLEGTAAYQAETAKGKGKAKLASRDHANGRAVAIREKFLARFPAHPRSDEIRLGLARALLRRAAYIVVGPEVEPDRKRALELLGDIVSGGAASRASRDASFMLAERAVRDKDWPKVLVHEERVLKFAAQKSQADDHAFLAAATARVAQARLETGDLARAKTSLEEAIALGMVCAPRTECVVAASAARRVLAATWAATSLAPRSMVGTLQKGALPRGDRVRPLLQLADLYATGSGTGCKVAAEEARAWEQSFP